MRMATIYIVVSLSVISAIAGIGMIYTASLVQHTGLPQRYRPSSRANIHDTYYTTDMFGLIRITVTSDARLGWTLLLASLMLFCGAAIWMIRFRLSISRKANNSSTKNS